jgi:hypothetical protein
VNCLFCDKRLSFFHGKKKPYCSDVHEDRYRERQARTGLDRLQDQSLLGPPKLPEPFPQAKPAPAIEAPELEETLELSAPPVAEYLIANGNEIPLALSDLPGRDPGDAAFPEECWETAPVLQSSAALVRLSAAQIGPGLITFSPVVPEPQVVEQTQSEPPSPVTEFAPLGTRPLAFSEAIATRIFCAPPLAIAVPGLALPPRRRMLAQVTESARTGSSEPGARETLPSPEPLRFRTVLDLHNPVFQTTKRRIAPARQVSLDWNAIPPETVLWQSKPTRRPVALVLPRLSGGVTRQLGGADR